VHTKDQGKRDTKRDYGERERKIIGGRGRMCCYLKKPPSSSLFWRERGQSAEKKGEGRNESEPSHEAIPEGRILKWRKVRQEKGGQSQ